MSKLRLFIGSSKEGKDIADFLQLGLDHDVEVTVWHQGVFGLSKGSLDDLVNASHKFDFAALILTPDDLTNKREKLSTVLAIMLSSNLDYSWARSAENVLL